VKFGKIARSITLAGLLSTTTCTTGGAPMPEPVTLVSRLQNSTSELYRIGIESTKDNIERGGIGVIESDRLVIYEIENDVRADEERYSRFANGENSLYPHLMQRVQTASTVQVICTPSAANAFLGTANLLIADLSRIMTMSLELRLAEAQEVYPRFDAHVRHHMYIADSQRTEELKDKPRTFCFHTHWNGAPPSEVDVQLSHTRPEVVISIGPLARAIYYINKGQTEIIHQDSPTALR